MSMPRQQVRDFGTSLFFNGTTAKCFNATAVAGVGTASTLATWFRVANPNSTTAQVIVTANTDTNHRTVISIQTGILRGGYFNGSAYTPKSSDGYLTPNLWYHAAMVWDGTATTLYLNNVVQAGTGQNPSSGSTAGTMAGMSTAGTTPFWGFIDSFKVWTRALSASEIESLYLAGTYDTTSMWADWKFDEGSGTTATDSSGAGHNGTITAATYASEVFIKPRTAVT